MNREHTIYVVSFCPADDQGGVSGYNWHPDKDKATEAYLHEVKESHRAGGGYIVRLVEMTTKYDPATTPSQFITDELEHRSDEHESTTPALRQYIPARTRPSHIPTGGTTRNPHPSAPDTAAHDTTAHDTTDAAEVARLRREVAAFRDQMTKSAKRYKSLCNEDYAEYDRQIAHVLTRILEGDNDE